MTSNVGMSLVRKKTPPSAPQSSVSLMVNKKVSAPRLCLIVLI